MNAVKDNMPCIYLEKFLIPVIVTIFIGKVAFHIWGDTVSWMIHSLKKGVKHAEIEIQLKIMKTSEDIGEGRKVEPFIDIYESD